MAELTKAEKILIAARRLDAKGHSAFSAEDLVVEAFKTFPGDFALKGYPDYPDNNSILTLLMGKDARLIVSGWLEKTGTKKYRLTTKGVHDAAALADAAGLEHAGSTTSRSSRQTEEALGHLLTSDAFQKFRAGDAESITFHQFCRFLGLAAPDTWQKIQGKIEAARHVVDEARKLGEAGQNLRINFRGANHTYMPDDLMTLKAAFDALGTRFKREMDAWETKLRAR